jgi:archaeosine synthase beta-subunit
VEPVATIFLTNRECPFRCLMCDLWRNTLTETVPVGAIPAQIDHALLELPPARQLKLYNSGSFFDPHAIPPHDYGAIAQRANRFDRLIVENHPALTGDACLRFRDLLSNRLEVAMGLETAQPEVLARLNKRMTLDQFSNAANFLRRNEIDLRVFILVQPPYMPAAEALHWAERSLDFAMEHGATAAVLIPTRAGNGVMDDLMANGQFAPPALHTLESAMEYGLGLKAGRVFADLWGLRPSCAGCQPLRADRLRKMNLEQAVLDRIACDQCGGAS